jgi:predicted DNA-binding ribbon-helix-helix protein
MNDFEQVWKHHTEEDTLDDLRGKLVTYHIRIGECRTTVRLTCTTWRLLHEIAQRAGITVHELGTAISLDKPRAMALTVAIRSAVLRHYLDAARDAPG